MCLRIDGLEDLICVLIIGLLPLLAPGNEAVIL